MDLKLILFTLALQAIFIFLVISDYRFQPPITEWYPYLSDQKSGAVRSPTELMNFSRMMDTSDEYYESRNAFERLYDVVDNLNIAIADPTDFTYTDQEQLRASGWPVANQDTCGRQLDWLVHELYSLNSSYLMLKGKKGFELTRVVGSIGKPEAATFSDGLTTWLGSYERCLRSTISTMQQQEPFKMRFCWSRMRPKMWPKNETILPANVIRVGTCLPEACDTLSAQNYASQIESLVKFDWPNSYAENLDFESMFCLPDERSPIRQIPLGGRVYLFVLGAWLALVLAATVLYEVNKSKQESQMGQKNSAIEEHSLANSIANALSIHCTIKRLKAHRFRWDYKQSRLDPSQKPRVDLSCLDAFKFLMALFIVVGHANYLVATVSNAQINKLEINTGPIGNLTILIAIFVNSFFIVSGVLATYTLMRKYNAHQLGTPKVWFCFNFGILLRVWPLYTLVYCFSRYLSPYLGVGPWWDYGERHESIRGICLTQSWYIPIPYFYKLANQTCIRTGWFIDVYCILALFVPMITYTFVKTSKTYHRITLLAFFGAISIAQTINQLSNITSLDVSKLNQYGSLLLGLVLKYDGGFLISPQDRVIYVFSGCYIGYLIRKYEVGEIEHWPRWIHSKFTLISVIFLGVFIYFAPFIGQCLFTTTSLAEVITGLSISSIAWPTLNGIFIICATTVYNHTACVRFFGHPFWQAFNRLGLSIYLVHWELLFNSITSYERAPPYGFAMDFAKSIPFALISTILVALVVHILFEAPVTELVTNLIAHFSRPKPKKTIELENTKSSELQNV